MKLVRLTRYDGSSLWVNPLTVTDITTSGKDTQVNGYHVKEAAEIVVMKMNAALEDVNVEQWLRGKGRR